ncbi:PAS domain-containing sensor histidine kinase [Maricaulis sp.]|uniref:sensor histidine kinase n=1 Tax=Maricaulis sp. TaxID=1486257 RepID=UPI0025BE9D0D|nr:PAS domain-containing sensor histidine kinase [Maricaulis sp.]
MPNASRNTLIRNISPRSAALFGAGFLVSLGLLGVAAFILLNEGGLTGANNRIALGILVGNLVLLLGLAGVVVLRFVRRVRARRFGEPTPRLHLRFVALFSIAAATPAVLAAIFLGFVITRGVDLWFDDRIATLVDRLEDVAFDFYGREATTASGHVESMATDLSQEGSVDAFTTSRIQYINYLNFQAARRGFAAAYIVDGRGTLLARTRFRENEEYAAPSQVLYDYANDGDVAVSTPSSSAEAVDVMRLLYRLDAYPDAYLFVSYPVNIDLFREMAQARNELRDAGSQESRVRGSFYFLYFEVAVLIVIGSIWLALSAATRVVTPISRLVGAAERVRRGDLDARVQMGREDDEIAALARAFNRMTRQLRSQRRELIEAHAESEQRRAFIEAILAGVRAGVIGLDKDNRITLINRSAISMLAPGTDDLIGVGIDEVTPELAEIAAEARRRPGSVAEAQIDLNAPDDQIRHLTARASMDEEAGLVITFDDVTRLVTAQRNAAWREVARRIAHEIKNPLTPIQLSAERIRRKYRDEITSDVETFDRCTDTIVRQVSDIGRMVDEFSSFARMPQPKVERVEMGELVKSSVFTQRVASPNIEIVFEHPGMQVHAMCDARLSVQALANILKNACESVSTRMDQDGAPGQLVVSLTEANGYAVIEVADNGLGWPTPNRERLTEPYMTTREKGTGLGLAIVKRVMEDHNGRLELDIPRSGQGAVVRLVFPLADMADPAPQSLKEA